MAAERGVMGNQSGDSLRELGEKLVTQLEQVYVLGGPQGDEALRIALELRHFLLVDDRIDNSKRLDWSSEFMGGNER